jgi:hypothetical protein
MAEDSVKELKIKNIEQDADDDVELPEIPSWDRIFGRPTSLGDLDPDAETRLDDIDATFLTLGDVAYLDSITETYIDDDSVTTPKLAAGAVIASKIAANAVTADKINVSELSAISADIGTVTAGDIRGARIRTSTSGDRVEISDTDDSIKIYDAGDLRLEIYQDRITFYEDDGISDVVSLYASPTGNFLLAGTGSNDILMSSQRDFTINAEDDLFIFADDTINLNTGALADDIYIGLGSNTFMQFGDGRVYLDTYIDMNFNDITDGGDFTCVSLTETSDIRMKKNIKPLPYGLKEVLQLEPIEFRFKKHIKKNKNGRREKTPLAMDDAILEEKSKQKHLGFSAQDVYKIMPELTRNGDESSDEPVRLYTTQMIPVLVHAIQELHNEIELLKK